jgi:hypothetical protein
MPVFSDFVFPVRREGRKQLVSDVMPKSTDLTYFVLLADAYLHLGGRDHHVTTFRQLRDHMGISDDLHALHAARSSGMLSEGRHELPDSVAACLSRSTTAFLEMRRWSEGAPEPTVSLLSSSQIIGGWAAPSFDEVEVAAVPGTWYFRAKDDDCLVFLAVRGERLKETLKTLDTSCLEIDGSFVYSP